MQRSYQENMAIVLSKKILKVTQEKNKANFHSNIVSVKINGNKIEVFVKLPANFNEIPIERSNRIKAIIRKYLKQSNLNTPMDISISSQNISIAAPTLLKFLLKLKMYGAPTWNDFREKVEYKGNLSTLHPFIQKSIFNEEFFDQFKHFKSQANLLTKPIFIELFIEIEKTNLKLNSTLSRITDNAMHIINEYSHVKRNNSDSYEVDFSKLMMDIVISAKNSLAAPSDIWSILQTLKSFLEDAIDDYRLLERDLTDNIKRLQILNKAHNAFLTTFEDIEQDDIVNILSTNNLYINAPQPSEYVQENAFINECLSRTTSNIKFFESGIEIINQTMELHCQALEFDQAIHKFFIDALDHEENNDAIETEDSAASIESMQSKSDYPIQSHGFFATTIDTQQTSVTFEIQQAAKDKIKNEERKAAKKLDKKNNIPQVTSSSDEDNKAMIKVLDKNKIRKENEVHDDVKVNWHTIYLKSKSSDEIIQSRVYCLPGTKHLFMCCDIAHLNYQNKTIAEELQKIALLGQTISRDSYNKSGLKIYGHNLVTVKSCNKTAAHGFRLICLPHRIQDIYVYIPEKIVSHDEYVKLVNNKRKLQEMTRLTQEKLVVSFTAEECTATLIRFKK